MYVDTFKTADITTAKHSRYVINVLVIMYVKIFKTDIIVFICNIIISSM
jgi:hypothetical protein